MRLFGIPFGAAIASHLTALGAGFLWLDHAHLEDKLALQLRGALTGGFAGTGYYRPLMSLSLSIDAAIGGGAPFVFHVTSLLFHAAAATLTAIAAEALGLSRRAAIVAGVLFAVHPLSGLVANAIAFRSEAIIACTLLALVWAHLRSRPVLAGLAMLAGALTKETAFVLGPLFVLALTRLENKKQDRRVLGAEAAGFAAAGVLRLVYAPSWRASHAALSIGDSIGTRLAAIAKSTAAIVLPVDRSICDAFPITHLWHPTSIAGLALLLGVAVLAFRDRRKIGLLLGLSLLPALQLVPVLRWWSPHYVYVPFAFGAMLLARFVEDLLKDRTQLFAIASGCVLGAISLYDARRYSDDASLWYPEVLAQPACREGQFYLGETERQAKHWEAAARRYEAALASQPKMIAYVDRPAALQNLGTVRLEQRRFADARTAFTAALDVVTEPGPRRRELTHNLAAAMFGDNDPAGTVRLLEPEVAHPDALPASIQLYALAQKKLAGRH